MIPAKWLLSTVKFWGGLCVYSNNNQSCDTNIEGTEHMKQINQFKNRLQGREAHQKTIYEKNQTEILELKSTITEIYSSKEVSSNKTQRQLG